MNHSHLRNAGIAIGVLIAGFLGLLIALRVWPEMPEMVGKAAAAGLTAIALFGLLEIVRWILSPFRQPSNVRKERAELDAVMRNRRLSAETRQEAKRRLDELGR